MSIVSELVAGGAQGAFTGIGSLAKDLREAITGEIPPEKKAEIESKLVELEFAARKAQSDINIVEAQSPRLFVSGWRPFIGWVCGAALLYTFIFYPFLEWVVKFYGLNINPPDIRIDALMELIIAMLGLGGLRTYEKLKGVHSK